MTDSVYKRAPRVRFINIRSGEGITAQFNPTEFEEGLEVQYTRQQVLGLSHQVLQYINTGNHRFSMELFWDRNITPEIREENLGDIGVSEITELSEAKAFFESLCYPTGGATSITSGAPPRVLVVWPGVLSMTCVVMSMNTVNERFNYLGETVQATMSIQFEEIRDVRITSQEVRQFGARRTRE